jgi:hypothetical protein
MAPPVAASFPEQGWNLLRNSVVVFDDTGGILIDKARNGVVLFDDYRKLLPDGRVLAPPPAVTALNAHGLRRPGGQAMTVHRTLERPR